MGYYADLIKEKRNARDYDEINKVYKEAKRIVDELRRKYREISGRESDDGNFLYSIIEEKGMPTTSSDQQKARHAAGLLESARRMSTVPRDWGNSNSEEKANSILSTEHYKGYTIEIYKAKQGVDYGFNIYDKNHSLFDWGTYFDSERDALRWAKLAIDRKNNSKEEKGYYAKLAEEKAAKRKI